MLKNDCNCVYRDITGNEDISKLIEEMRTEHESDSVAGPYVPIYDLDEAEEELPIGWTIEVDKERSAINGNFRICLFELATASNTADVDRKGVVFKAIKVGAVYLIDDYEGALDFDSSDAPGPLYVSVLSEEGDVDEFPANEISKIEKYIEYLKS